VILRTVVRISHIRFNRALKENIVRRTHLAPTTTVSDTMVNHELVRILAEILGVTIVMPGAIESLALDTSSWVIGFPWCAWRHGVVVAALPKVLSAHGISPEVLSSHRCGCSVDDGRSRLLNDLDAILSCGVIKPV
jgi:hypothetical protein